MNFRPEISNDVEAIYDLTKLAFTGKPYAGGDEQEVVDRLRRIGELSLSLVAEEGGMIVGQITFSQASIRETAGLWMALGPVSVLPQHQGKGIGGALIEEGIKRITEQAALGCILTGNPVYYRRFGFEFSPANTPENEPEEFFMLKRLSDVEPRGRFSFHPAFYGEV